jgi:hypothetical protein
MQSLGIIREVSHRIHDDRLVSGGWPPLHGHIFAQKLLGQTIPGAGMARRAKSSDAPLGLVVVGGGVIWALTQASSDFWIVIAIIGGGIGILAIISLIVRNIQRERVRRAVRKKAAATVKQHLASLVRRREQLVRQDAYGKPLLEDWIKEISYFIQEHVKPLLTPQEQLALVSEVPRLYEHGSARAQTRPSPRAQSA